MKLQQFFQEDNHNFSSARLGFLLWVVGTLVVWIINSLNCGKLQDVPESVAVILGILMTGKVAQKFGEEKKS